MANLIIWELKYEVYVCRVHAPCLSKIVDMKILFHLNDVLYVWYLTSNFIYT